MKVKQIVSDFLDSNVYIVSHLGEAIIIDAGANIDKVSLAVGKNRVVGILLTHGHFDHVAYIEEYQKKFQCPIYLHKKALHTMKNPELNYSRSYAFHLEGEIYPFDCDSDIQFDKFLVEAFTTSGHSPCCVSYLIGENIFAGDCVFKTGIGRTDLLESSDTQMLKSIRKFINFKFKQLYSGHGEASSFDEQQRNLDVFEKYIQRKIKAKRQK